MKNWNVTIKGQEPMGGMWVKWSYAVEAERRNQARIIGRERCGLMNIQKVTAQPKKGAN